MSTSGAERHEIVTRAEFRFVVVAGLVLWLLVIGRNFLIPLAFAVLIANLMAAMVDRISRIRFGRRPLPRWLSTVLGIALVLFALFVVVRILAAQADSISAVWPGYVTRFEALVAKAGTYLGDDVSAEITDAVASLNIARTLSGVVGSAGSFLVAAGLVLLYVAFLVVEQANLPAKLDGLFPEPDKAARVRRMMQAISASVRRYIWIKTIMSLLTGGASYVVMELMGLHFAETWGLIIFFLNYIPNIGSALGIVFPAMLALVQFDTLGPFLVLTATLTVVQTVIGNVIEPAFMGRSLNLSSFVIILSLIFWGALWGVAGMFLSVPITVMAMIVCTHVPRWHWIAVMLSADGRVEPATT